jgi:DNA-binding XRE family transcriptional regulator
MEDNTTIFWDKRISTDEARRVLEDELNPRFIELASLLLARTNKPKMVFSSYLTQEAFVMNWAKIKRRMRENRWNDTRIIFWDEIYRAVKKNKNFKGLKELKERPLRVDPEIKIICDQIRDVRQKSGLTQIKLAEKSGISQQSISFVEQGYVNISLRTLKKIADALNLKIVLKDKANL